MRKRQTAEDVERRAQAHRDAARLRVDLDKIEAGEHALLQGLGYPTDDMDRLARAVWATEADAPGRRARLALGTLMHLRQLRRYVADDNAALAAVEALRVGFYADTVLLDAEAARKGRRTGNAVVSVARATAGATRRAEWQAIADTLQRGHSKGWAARLVREELQKQREALRKRKRKRPRLPEEKTIRNAIAYPK